MTRRKPKPPRPTAAELQILRVLWKRGPSTVRQVHQELARSREVAYTTVLRFLQIMTEKGHVSRDDAERSHVYTAAVDQEGTQRQFLRDLTDRLFEGSTQKLLLKALETGETTPEELEELSRVCA